MEIALIVYFILMLIFPLMILLKPKKSTELNPFGKLYQENRFCMNEF
jgi:hypothetical protein